jgi:hypothetical protein
LQGIGKHYRLFYTTWALLEDELGALPRSRGMLGHWLTVPAGFAGNENKSIEALRKGKGAEKPSPEIETREARWP